MTEIRRHRRPRPIPDAIGPPAFSTLAVVAGTDVADERRQNVS